MEEDWDNLIILDACRYDMFKVVNDIKGQLEYRISRGSATNQFLKENFKGKVFFDTIYVTSNPMVNYHIPNSFAKIISVWEKGWHEKYGTVLPDTMVEFARMANTMFPNKRLIIHFLQPHYPFIGKVSRVKIGEHEGLKSRNFFRDNMEKDHRTQEIWNMLRIGKVSKNDVWEAYNENLRIVMGHVKNLIPNLEGKTVITSDHGNLFGEMVLPFPVRYYGHTSGIFHRNLVKVPYFIPPFTSRKTIVVSDTMGKTDSIKNVDLEKKLEALGYFQ